MMTAQLIDKANSTTIEASPQSGAQGALLYDMELSLRKTFYPLGYSVEIITNEPNVLAAAEESFGHSRFSRESTQLQVRIGVIDRPGAVCPPEPTRRAQNHLYSLVADAENHSLLDLNTGANFTWLTKAAAQSRLYARTNFLEKVVYLLLGATVVTDIHAACVSKNGKGVLLCGNSGAGKSTLAYACARDGWSYTSDDTSYLMNDSEIPRVIGHCHRARFRPSARALFPELEGRPLTPRMEGKPSIEVPISKLPVQHATPEATVNCIVFLNRYSGAAVNVSQLAPGLATRRISRELFSTGEIRAKHQKVLEKLGDIPAFDLQYQSMDDGIRALDLLTLRI
jgi:hypothetical protein